MHSFYITLVSNSSTKVFPANNASSFKTILPKPIRLIGDYEVALVEMTYPQTIKTLRHNDAWIRLRDTSKPNMLRKQYLRDRNYQLFNQILWELNDFIHRKEKRMLEDANESADFKMTADFERDREKHLMSFRLFNKDGSLEFSQPLSKILGFYPHPKPANKLRAMVQPNINAAIDKHLFVCCDIISPQIYGDGMNNVLKQIRVNVKNYTYGSVGGESFRELQYVPVDVAELNEIEIHIKNSNNQIVLFESGYSTLLLHFRRK